MKYRVATNFVPNNSVDLGNLVVSPANQIALQSKGGTIYNDSVWVELPTEDWNTLNQWIIFHTFLLDSGMTLYWYENEEFSGLTATETNLPGRLVADFGNITEQVYQGTAPPLVLRYDELYKVFAQATVDDLDLIKTYILNLSGMHVGSGIQENKQISDTSYWEMLAGFSIIESVLGNPPTCNEKLDCKKCTAKDINHYSVSQSEWIRSRLSEIIKDKAIAEEYAKIVLEARQRIRHKVAHSGSGSYPTAKRIVQEMGTKVWGIDEAVENFTTNQAALLSFKLSLRYVARYLLLDKVFCTGIFRSVPVLHSARMSLG